MVKKILLTIAVVISWGAVVVGGAWCSAQHDDSPCSELRIVVEDSLKRQFVETDELEGFLKRSDHYPLSKAMALIDCHAIEGYMMNHEMVRSAACYKSPFGCVYVCVTQREPVLKVVGNDGCYYVDSDRRVMPLRKQIEADVPVFRGAISKRAASEEYFDFVQWLNSNHYWGERIQDIYVYNTRYLVLSQKDLHAKIVLGDLSGYADKLAKLQKLYTQGFEKIGYPEYREYDLRFAGQVVGRK